MTGIEEVADNVDELVTEEDKLILYALVDMDSDERYYGCNERLGKLTDEEFTKLTSSLIGLMESVLVPMHREDEDTRETGRAKLYLSLLNTVEGFSTMSADEMVNEEGESDETEDATSEDN